jgi:hypothetical protein
MPETSSCRYDTINGGYQNNSNLNRTTQKKTTPNKTTPNKTTQKKTTQNKTTQNKTTLKKNNLSNSITLGGRNKKKTKLNNKHKKLSFGSY